MGKKLDALLGRSFKNSRFKSLVNLAISRLVILKNQHSVRCSQARADVVQLLTLGEHQRALLRVERVIKEQSMLDAFVIIEGYCLLLVERVSLLAQERGCPDELKEAIASLIYAASRCGEFPELREIRTVFSTRYGREFVARAIELRNDCGVNPLIIQKLSTRSRSLETRMQVLKEIATENSISLQLQELRDSPKDKVQMEDTSQLKAASFADSSQRESDGFQVLPEELLNDGQFSSSMKRRQYSGVADAAQAAFESAAYAAAAAREAVILSRPDRDDHDSQGSAIPPGGKVSGLQLLEFTREFSDSKDLGKAEDKTDELGFEMIQCSRDYQNDSEDKKPNERQSSEYKLRKNAIECRTLKSTSSSDSGDILKPDVKFPDVVRTKLSKEITFDDSANESAATGPTSLPFRSQAAKLLEKKIVSDKRDGESGATSSSSYEDIPLRLQTAPQVAAATRKAQLHPTTGSKMQNVQGLNLDKRPISMRTRR